MSGFAAIVWLLVSLLQSSGLILVFSPGSKRAALKSILIRHQRHVAAINLLNLA